LLATAAITAAQFEMPSMRIYRGGNVTGTSGSIDEAVKQYLSLCMNLSYNAIMESPYSYMSQGEKEKYLAQAEVAATGVSLLELNQGEAPQEQALPPPLTKSVISEKA
jgi:hypothetical protein